MKFGEVPVAEAADAILVHSLKTPARTLKKGRRLTGEDVASLAEAGIRSILAARLDPGELGEDEAANRLARAVAGAHIRAAEAFTGRANLYAETRGLCVVDRQLLDAFNLVDEAVTLATVPPFALVEPKQMVATIKIVPFAVPERVVDACAALGSEGEALVRVAPFLPLQARLIQTRLSGLKESVLDKTVAVTKARLAALGGALGGESRCAHAVADLASQIKAAAAERPDLLLIAGASAIVDRRDVIPAALEAAGGTIEHFGMPVDPGNLILLGRLEGKPVLGLPGCARSPKENGFDWVLQRLLAGLAVTRQDVMRMGAGGLLAEIPTRPLPRASAALPARAAPRIPQIGALILAAGQSRRMGEVNKLLIEIEGKAMVRHVAETVLASGARPVVAVLGHERDRVRAALGGMKLRCVYNAAYAEGISSSLKRGLGALPDDLDGVLVCLGDMPLLGAGEIDRLIAAFNPTEGRSIIVPTRRGKRGNPVLWARRFFAEMQAIAGDVGARHLIGAYPEAVAEIEMTGEGVLLDIDTPEALSAFLARGTVEA
ncbi:MAG: molybdopterin-binding/glycosyltransferase family 2 protein [Alphaproteobacteria bacterium]|nr:molybdopterin-binding/glycosyltransferase family 2 protein [Alphaproteobacteria bacterium]